MFTPFVLISVTLIVWALASLFMYFSLQCLRNGNWVEQMTYEQTSGLKVFGLILFAPVVYLAMILKGALENWHYTSAIILVVVFAVALTGCQTNVVTAPNSTFMVDSAMVCKPAQ